MTTYYVSSGLGNDNNAGTSASAPFATLQVAADHTHPGDTVLVMNGTYTANPGGDVLSITTSGTASAPITFMAAPGQTPVIDSSECWQGILISASYIVVDGFTVVGNAATITQQDALANSAPGDPHYDGNGISAINANHIIIQNNTVYNEPGGGIGTLGGVDYLQILNNTVHDNAHWSAYGNSGISIFQSTNSDTAPGNHIVVSGNLVYNNSELVPEYRANAITDGEGIILDTNPGFVGTMLVENNTVYNNGGPGIESNGTDNAVITGNTVYGNNTQNLQAPSNAQIFINHSNNNTVTNNNFNPNDHTPPLAPVITGDTVEFNVVTLTGTAEVNSTITVFDNSTQLGTATTNANGQWSFTTAALANGSQSFTATATDLSLNESTPSSPLVVVLNGPINLVVNGSFENNFTGWTASGNVAELSYGPQLFITSSAHSGQDAAGFGSVGSDGTISQNLTTVVGQSYTLDFWLANASGGPNDFTAKIGGVTELHLVNAAAQPYTHYDFTFTATSTSTPLEFDFRQDPSHWSLDDVSVVQATGSAPHHNHGHDWSAWQEFHALV